MHTAAATCCSPTRAVVRSFRLLVQSPDVDARTCVCVCASMGHNRGRASGGTEARSRASTPRLRPSRRHYKGTSCTKTPAGCSHWLHWQVQPGSVSCHPPPCPPTSCPSCSPAMPSWPGFEGEQHELPCLLPPGTCMQYNAVGVTVVVGRPLACSTGWHEATEKAAAAGSLRPPRGSPALPHRGVGV